jgi:hypothetical protein
MSEVTRLLTAIDCGDPKAAEELLPLLYDESRKLAAHKMAHEAPGQTLQPTALVHAAWLRLAGSNRQPWPLQTNLLGVAPLYFSDAPSPRQRAAFLPAAARAVRLLTKGNEGNDFAKQKVFIL